MKIHKIILLALALGLTATNVYAADLMDVYEKAFANDPTFKGAKATWLANREALAISRADLLPTLGGQVNIARTRSESETNRVHTINGTPISTPGTSHNYNNTSGYSLQLTQPIFNFGSWANVWGAQAAAKKAKADFMAAEEDLLKRIAQAYFNVLQAKDVLSYSVANKASVERLFIQTKHKFDVGLVPVTDLEDARKNYDIAISQEIGNANDLSNKIEELNEITGAKYSDLAQVKKDFPLLSPEPNDIEQWVKAAEKQNFSLTAARYDTINARENVKVQNAGHLPKLDATANYQYQFANNPNGDSSFNRSKTAQAGMQLTVPLFQGGKVLASARQADYQYQAKVSTQEKIHRSVISQTRQNYLGVLSNISKIKADIQAIKSAESSLRANQASYTVGTRTMADILNAQTQLYQAQQTFAKDEYAYIMQLLTLKELTGILDTNDLKEINSWLVKSAPVTTEETTAASKKPTKAKSTKAKKATKDHKKSSAKTTENSDAAKVTENSGAPKTTETTKAASKADEQNAATNVDTTNTKMATVENPATPTTTTTNTAAVTTTTTNTLAVAAAAPNAETINAEKSGKLIVLDTQPVESVAPTPSLTTPTSGKSEAVVGTTKINQ